MNILKNFILQAIALLSIPQINIDMPKKIRSAKLAIAKLITKNKYDKKQLKHSNNRKNNENINPQNSTKHIATHTLLIFNDYSECELGAVSIELMIAILQKSSPILASASLFQVIDREPDLEYLAKRLDTNAIKLHKLYQELDEAGIKKILTDLEKPIKYTVNHDIKERDIEHKDLQSFKDMSSEYYYAIYSTIFKNKFNPNEWVIKIVDDNERYLLLIPKNYIPTTNTPNLTNNNNGIHFARNKYTNTEYDLGIKLDKMRDIDHYKSLIESYSKNFEQLLKTDDPKCYLFRPTKGIQQILEDILISNKEYANPNIPKFKVPIWCIYLIGHGHPGSICDMPIEEFSQFLNFLDKRITTNLLCYTSCYSIGMNSDAISKNYSFIIATSGQTDTPSILEHNFAIENKKPKITSNINFANFVNIVQNYSNEYLYNALENLVLPQEYSPSQVIPLAKFPNSDWFKFSNAQNKIAVISETLAKTRKKAIDLDKYFSKTEGTQKFSPQYYFLSTHIIPFEIIVNKPVIFVPMASKQNTNTYFIKRLTANCDLDKIRQMFAKGIGCDFLATQIWIEELSIHGHKYKNVVFKGYSVDNIITYITDDQGKYLLFDQTGSMTQLTDNYIDQLVLTKSKIISLEEESKKIESISNSLTNMHQKH